MILDNTNIFSDGQAITATAVSTNAVDMGAPGTPVGAAVALVRDVAIGNRIRIFCNVTQVFNNLTSLKIALVTSDNADLSSAKEIASRTYLAAELAATGQLEFPSAVIIGATKRYLGLSFTVVGTAPSTGKISSGIVAARTANAL